MELALFRSAYHETVGKKRKEWVDALRALAIFFVIYGHLVKGWTAYYVFTSPIKICLFFAISGYVFKYDRVKEGEFYYSLFRKLIIPWLVFSLLPYAIAIPIKGVSFFYARFVTVITGKSTLWYMPCCIIAEIIWHYLNRFIKKEGVLIIASLVFFALGLFLGKCGLLDLLMINRAMAVQAFLVIGSVYKKHEEYLLEKLGKPQYVCLGFFVYVILGIITMVFYPGQNLDVHTNKYYNFTICGLMILIGIVVIFIIFEKYIKKYPPIVTLVGQNTLVIYICNNLVISVIRFVSKRTGLPYDGIFPGLITAVIACVACTVLSLLTKKLMPEIFGIKRRL